MPRIFGYALLAVAFSPLHARAQSISNLQSVPVFFTCLAQDEDAAKAFLSGAPSANEVSPEAKQRLDRMVGSSTWATCVRRKQWVSKEFCRELLDAYKPGGGVDLRPVMSKHENEMQQLKPLYDYFEAAFPRGGVERLAAPACPG